MRNFVARLIGRLFPENTTYVVHFPNVEVSDNSNDTGSRRRFLKCFSASLVFILFTPEIVENEGDIIIIDGWFLVEADFEPRDK